MKDSLIERLAERCWLELGYWDVVNERLEEIDYELIVECVLRHLREEDGVCFGQ